MKKEKKKKWLWISICLLMLLLNTAYFISGYIRYKEPDIQVGSNYLGQPVGPANQLIAASIIYIFLIIFLLHTIFKKETDMKEKLTGKQKRKVANDYRNKPPYEIKDLF